MALARLRGAALDLLFPPRCGACGRDGAFLCDPCRATLVPAAPPRCPRCWQPAVQSGDCPGCTAMPLALDGLRAGFVYQGTARTLVHALKYRGMTALAPPLASLLTAAARLHQLDADVVVPVPLAGLRGRLRGYNQAEALARPLANELGLAFSRDALARRRHTPPQARSADAETRRRNVQGAFVCRKDDTVAGRRVLLVDDVATTGATLGACASALREAGADAVWGLVFARED